MGWERLQADTEDALFPGAQPQVLVDWRLCLLYS